MSTTASSSHPERRLGERRSGDKVPFKTIAATIAMVVGTYLLWVVVKQVSYILQLIAVAVFFALALNPLVDYFERRFKLRRGLASSIVFFGCAIAVIALLYLFVRPLIDQTLSLIDKLPSMVADARNGRGAVGELVQRYDLNTWVTDNQERVRSAVTNSTASLLALASTVASTVAGILTVLVLTFLMLLEGPQMLRAPLVFFAPDTQRHIRRVARESAHAVNGYVTGNFVISIIAGTVTFIALTATGVPFATVLAVWVAFADLIPLVGATLGAIPTVGVAFLHSTEAGIINLVVYVVYQQIENHILQTTIMARTVRLNPLVVLISVLLGVAIGGFIGAIFAIPAAGVLQVVGRDLLETYGHRLKGNVDEVEEQQTEAAPEIHEPLGRESNG